MISNNYEIVTCIYDIGRSAIDGRTINDYSEWILKTFAHFPNITIYYDSEKIRSPLDNGQNWLYKGVEEFALINAYDKVSKICEVLQKKSNDLTFKLPMYSLLQFEKFQFLADQKLRNPNAKGFLWVDAGISRFINSAATRTSQDQSQQTIKKILSREESIFEVDPRGNLSIFRNLKHAKTGTCTRTFSGTSFYLDQGDVISYAENTVAVANFWIDNFQWDNEQIGLNHLFLSRIISPRILLQKGLTGSVARYMLGMENTKIISPWKIRKFGIQHPKSHNSINRSLERYRNAR